MTPPLSTSAVTRGPRGLQGMAATSVWHVYYTFLFY